MTKAIDLSKDEDIEVTLTKKDLLYGTYRIAEQWDMNAQWIVLNAENKEEAYEAMLSQYFGKDTDDITDKMIETENLEKDQVIIEAHSPAVVNKQKEIKEDVDLHDLKDFKENQKINSATALNIINEEINPHTRKNDKHFTIKEELMMGILEASQIPIDKTLTVANSFRNIQYLNSSNKNTSKSKVRDN